MALGTTLSQVPIDHVALPDATGLIAHTYLCESFAFVDFEIW
jgi:hypothetical protein